jgi:hypothetical protein
MRLNLIKITLNSIAKFTIQAEGNPFVGLMPFTRVFPRHSTRSGKMSSAVGALIKAHLTSPLGPEDRSKYMH